MRSRAWQMRVDPPTETSKACNGVTCSWVQIPPPPPWGSYETTPAQVTKPPARDRKRFLAGGFCCVSGHSGVGAGMAGPAILLWSFGAAVSGQQLAPVGVKADELPGCGVQLTLCRWWWVRLRRAD